MSPIAANLTESGAFGSASSCAVTRNRAAQTIRSAARDRRDHLRSLTGTGSVDVDIPLPAPSQDGPPVLEQEGCQCTRDVESGIANGSPGSGWSGASRQVLRWVDSSPAHRGIRRDVRHRPHRQMARGLQPRSAVKPARPGQTSERSRAACWKAGLAALALLTLAVRALAQTAAEPPSGQDPTLAQQAPATQQPAPTTPVPLFPRHRRGLYKNGLGLWVLDATPQSPPLDTDDPSVPDKGAYEINLTTDTDASRL